MRNPKMVTHLTHDPLSALFDVKKIGTNTGGKSIFSTHSTCTLDTLQARTSINDVTSISCVYCLLVVAAIGI